MTTELEQMNKRLLDHQMAAEELFIINFLRHAAGKSMTMRETSGSPTSPTELSKIIRQYVEQAHQK